MFFFNWDYMIFMLPAFLAAGVAQLLTTTTFKRYSRVRSSFGLTGAQAARRMLDQNGLHDVQINCTRGFLSDHYNPVNRTLNLSPDVYQSPSLSAVGVACHEAGHALQHANGYAPLQLRSALVPVASFSTHAAYAFIFLGFIVQAMALAKLGVLLLGASVLFALITLPVEWNASARAKQQMLLCGICGEQEQSDAGKVLNAAFLTYVAALFSALMTMLYYLTRLGLLGGRDD